MAEFELHPGRMIGGENPCYIIAEAGQNHQGSLDIAMRLVKAAIQANCDCIKFQKSYLNHKFNRKALERPYQSVHSFGKTYGEHKAALDLTDQQFHHLREYALNEGIQFTASAMDKASVDFLVHLGVPFLKIGSGDVNNYPLIKKAAATNLPIVLSTGMHGMDIIERSTSILSERQQPFALLQCASSYPCPPEDINLNVMKNYREKFPRAVIGYSGHELSWEISLAAVAMGAKIVERHLTLNHDMKGNDHKCSLEPEQFSQLVDKIRLIEKAFGSGTKQREPSEQACYRKLGKSIVAARHIKKGEIINEDMLDIKVADPPGIEAHHFYEIIGRKMCQDVGFDESLQFQNLV